MSPGVFAFLHIDLPAADYAVICFVPSADTGRPHANMGMHKIVTLN
jgi:hypothetical protein